MTYFDIAAFAAAVVFVIWAVFVQRRLAEMQANIKNAMKNIAMLFSSRFDVLTELLELTENYAERESTALMEIVKARRGIITENSQPTDVLQQEGAIAEILERILAVAEKYPELKNDENYLKCVNAAANCEKLVRSGRLVYNDSVTKLNREIKMFPISLLAGIFGFHRMDYLESIDEK